MKDCRVTHSSGCCYLWQVDYIMSRDGFANPALCACVRIVRAHVRACEEWWCSTALSQSDIPLYLSCLLDSAFILGYSVTFNHLLYWVHLSLSPSLSITQPPLTHFPRSPSSSAPCCTPWFPSSDWWLWSSSLSGCGDITNWRTRQPSSPHM